MALNYPGPYQLRIYYTVGSAPVLPLKHVIQFNVDLDDPPVLGDAFADMDCKARAVASHPLDLVVDELVAALVAVYAVADANFDYAELWSVEPLSFNMTYVSSYVIDEPGTDIGDTVPSGQTIFTYRTYEGGIMKVSLMETTGAAGPTVAYSDLSADWKAIADKFTGDADSFYLARDTSYPFLCLAIHPGTNEALFKARFRA